MLRGAQTSQRGSPQPMGEELRVASGECRARESPGAAKKFRVCATEGRLSVIRRRGRSPRTIGCIKQTVISRQLLAAVLAGASSLALSPPSQGRKPSDNPNRTIAASIRAEGGAKRLAAILTVEYQGTLTTPDGQASGHYTLILEQPNRLYEEVTMGNETIREAYNGKSAWRQDKAGLRTLTGSEGTMLEAAAHYRNDRLVHLRKEKVRLLALGDETVRGHSAERLEVTTLAGVKREVAIDDHTHLVLEELIPGRVADPAEDASRKSADDKKGGGDTRIFYDDYRPVDGVPEPYHIEVVAPDHDWVVTMTRVIHNPPVDDAVFRFPTSVGRPLPDIASLLHAVDAHQKEIEKLVEQYTCDKSQEEFSVDKHGAVKSNDTEEDQVFYLGGDEVDRMVKKNGKPLSPSEEKKQDDHIQKALRDYEKKQAKEAKEAKQGGEPKKKNDDDLKISDFLKIDRFTNPRWETYRGHEVIVFDFEPNPDYKPASMAEHILHELSGAIWIDQQDADAVRLEAYFTNSFKLAGGLLASLQKGSAFTFEQAKINNEVWMPSYLEVHFNAKVLLFKGFSGNFIQRYSNYQKFRVETVTRTVTHQFVPPPPSQAN